MRSDEENAMLEKIFKMFRKDSSPKSRVIKNYREFVAEFENAANDGEVVAKFLELTEKGKISWVPRGHGTIGAIFFEHSPGGRNNYENIDVELVKNEECQDDLEISITKKWHVLRFAKPIDEGVTGIVIPLDREKGSGFFSAVRENIRKIWEKKEPERERERIREVFDSVE